MIPSGVSTALVHMDAPISAIGDPGRIQITVASTVPLVWAATGTPLADFVDIIASDPGMPLEFLLPHTNQAGWVDGTGNAFINWSYIINISYEKEGQVRYLPERTIQLPTGTATLNLGNVPTGVPATPSDTAPGAFVRSVAGRSGVVVLAKADVGLSNVDNTSDANKPISTAAAARFDGRTLGDNTDFHAVTEQGYHRVLYFPADYVGSNMPANVRGVLHVLTMGSNRILTYRTYESVPRIFTQALVGGVWGAWRDIEAAGASAAAAIPRITDLETSRDGRLLADQVDFRTVTTAGKHKVLDFTNDYAAQNRPVAVRGVLDVSPLSSTNRVLTYITYEQVPRMFVCAREGGVWGAWREVSFGSIGSIGTGGTASGLKLVPLQLTLGSAAQTDGTSTGTYRYPMKWNAQIHRVRVNIQNIHPSSATVKTGAVDFTGLWVGKQSGTSGAFTAPPAQVQGPFSTPADGSKWTSKWFNLNQAPGIGDLLSLGYTAANGTVYTLGGNGWKTTSSADAGATNPAGITAVATLPFYIWLEAETANSTPHIGGMGDSLMSGVSAGGVQYSSLAQYCFLKGALPTHYSNSGDTLESWALNPNHYKWRVFDGLAVPDAVIIGGGSNDLNGSKTNAEIQGFFLTVAAAFKAMGVKGLYAANITPRSSSYSVDFETKRRTHNTWLSGLPGGIREVFNFRDAVSSDDENLMVAYDADGVHLNAAGYAAQAATITVPLTSPGVTEALAAANTYADSVKWDRGVTTADLNTLLASGRYAVNVTTNANLPAAVTGSVEVLAGTTATVQVYTTREAVPRVFRRNYASSVWGAWVDAKIGTAQTPAVLLSTDVLDNLGSGIYRSPTAGVAVTLGLPTGQAGALRVMKNTTTSGLMIWEPISATDPSVWVRSVSASGWTAWARIDGLKALADAKAYTDTKDAANRTAWAAGITEATGSLGTKWDLPGTSFAVMAGGRPTWLQVNDTDGGPTSEALSFLNLGQGGGGAAEIILPPERNFTISTYDGPRKLRSNPALLVGYGDSHMLGGASPSTRFMSILGTMFPGLTSINRGVGGNTTDLVAVRAGAIRPLLTFAGGQIPASGAVTVTTSDAIAYRNLGTFAVLGSVAGVPGTLARTTEYTLTFTRTTAGTAVSTGPAEFLSDDYALYSGAVQIILAGRNDIADDARLNDGSVPLSGAIDRAVSAYVAMVEAQSPVIKKTLLLGGLTDVSYVRGTPEYELVTGINRELARVYPAFFWDLRGYLVNQCIYDAGFTPTAEDLAAMAGDTLPPSIMLPDHTHIDVAAHAQVAIQLAEQLVSRKLVNP